MTNNGRIVAGNEFASVEISVEPVGNGEAVLVKDRRSGLSRRVDVVALEGLVWAPEWLIAWLADPSLGAGLNEEPDICEGRVDSDAFRWSAPEKGA